MAAEYEMRADRAERARGEKEAEGEDFSPSA
jgi:hypothetical protein